ncbi:hypothetical protein [Mucilaginibacter ginsenosidivorax]|uniref:Uncharacterized protein n=1 Tax=Mucilaginibacter ginsenosidivorax TaxID=862126 RepID=A0A5B8W283_9SPHI|nr:hypothetical protein [Mucilaginibacter ginsenosidivorax]QEC77823.1 hypothetical protein FSB76_18455 [Mucilaginibacter ginsenosidivorax]
MELILKKKKADAFVSAMQGLAKKFDGVYLPGQIEEFVKLDVVNGKMQLTFDKVVPEMVRIACTMAFVETLL